MISGDSIHFDSIRSVLDPVGHRSVLARGAQALSGEASIALVLRNTAALELLLVRRSVSERDPWSGHMALPGGRKDPVDASSFATAIRETHEECGLLLRPEAGLGRMGAVSPQGSKLPTLRVTPFVFGVESSAAAVVASHEIDAVFWVPLDELRDPANQKIVQIPLIGTVRDFPAYTVAGQTVWGMTYRVISRFLAQLNTLDR